MTVQQTPEDRAERVGFLKLAFLVEGSLLLVALAGAWFFQMKNPPWTRCSISVESIALGVIATIPMLLLLAYTSRSQRKTFVDFHQLVQDILGMKLAVCGWFDLCAVAVLAGISEEVLFRGVVESGLSGWGPIVALILCNLIFGLAHSVTPVYFVFAMLVGVYLSTTLWWTNEPNLIIPIVCHSLYDLVAFVVVRNGYFRSTRRLNAGTTC